MTAKKVLGMIILYDIAKGVLIRGMYKTGIAISRKKIKRETGREVIWNGYKFVFVDEENEEES